MNDSEHSPQINEIVLKKELAPSIKLFNIYTPYIARKVKPGQFVILRGDDRAERIPLTVADFDPEAGLITTIFQEVGTSTTKLGRLEAGDRIEDVVGPLGRPSEIERYGRVVCIGGGVGIPPIHPIARAMKQAGNYVIAIIGARSGNLVILEEEMRRASDELFVTTDDGTYGEKGLVTDVLRRLIGKGAGVHRVVAIGPVVMMRAVSELTRLHDIDTIVSLNPIMVDGTGMCGVCRCEIDGQTKFACVDGPEFDGHKVDYNLLMARQKIYVKEERQSMELFERSSQGAGHV